MFFKCFSFSFFQAWEDTKHPCQSSISVPDHPTFFFFFFSPPLLPTPCCLSFKDREDSFSGRIQDINVFNSWLSSFFVIPGCLSLFDIASLSCLQKLKSALSVFSFQSYLSYGFWFIFHSLTLIDLSKLIFGFFIPYSGPRVLLILWQGHDFSHLCPEASTFSFGGLLWTHTWNVPSFLHSAFLGA